MRSPLFIGSSNRKGIPTTEQECLLLKNLILENTEQFPASGSPA